MSPRSGPDFLLKFPSTVYSAIVRLISFPSPHAQYRRAIVCCQSCTTCGKKFCYAHLRAREPPAKMMAPTSIGKTLQNFTCVITVRASFHVVKSTDRPPRFHGAYGVVISGGRKCARSPLESSEMSFLYLWIPYVNPRKHLLEASFFTTIS